MRILKVPLMSFLALHTAEAGASPFEKSKHTLERTPRFDSKEHSLQHNLLSVSRSQPIDTIRTLWQDTLSWRQVGSDIDGEAPYDQSGYSVALSSDKSTLAIGAFNNDGAGNNSGHVRVFRLNESKQWVQVGEDLDGEAAGDLFGTSVAISNDGRTLAVGGIKHDSSAGHVRIYRSIGNLWLQIGADIDGESLGDESGRSVALSDDGSIVAIGAPMNDSESGQNSGHVRVYEFSPKSNSFLQLGEDIDGEGELNSFGFDVALSGDGRTVAIGLSKYLTANAMGSGNVRVFRFDIGSNKWTQAGNTIKGPSEADQFGISVALSRGGDVVAVGAPFRDANGKNSGSVSVYALPGEIWSLVGSEIVGESSNDASGISLDISDDGHVVAIGGFMNSGSNGDYTGHVRVYQLYGANWILIGDDLDGEFSTDLFGRSVSISGDGMMLAIGGPWNDGVNGQDTGHVRVFSLDIGTVKPSTSPSISHSPSHKPTNVPTLSLSPTASPSTSSKPTPYNGPTVKTEPPSTSLTPTSSDSTIFRKGLWKQLGQSLESNGETRVISMSKDGQYLAAGDRRFDCDDGSDCGIVFIYKLDGNIWRLHGLPITQNTKNSNFGRSLELSRDGNAVVIGSLSGTTSVYEFINGNWKQKGNIIIGEKFDDVAGLSVSIAGDGQVSGVTRPFSYVVAVGAPFNDGSGEDSGHVRVYGLMPSNEWMVLGSDLDGASGGDYFGNSMSLSADGRTIVIGSASFPSYVKVFRRSDLFEWEQLGGDIVSNETFDQFGYALSLSENGDIVAIGAPSSNYSGEESGAVTVYKLSNNSWINFGQIISENSREKAGSSISLSDEGNTIAVGFSRPQTLRIYRYFNLSWSQVSVNLDGLEIGSLSGDGLFVSGSGQNLIKSFRLTLDGNTLQPMATPTAIPTNKPSAKPSESTLPTKSSIPTIIPGNAFPSLNPSAKPSFAPTHSLMPTKTNSPSTGPSLSLIPTEAASGILLWRQVGESIFGIRDGDQSGFSISLSENGRCIAIGSPFSDSDSQNGGQVRVFQRNQNDDWQLLGQILNGENSQTRFGTSVDLSGSCQTLAVGGILNTNDSGVRGGHVRLYRLINERWVQVGGDIDGVGLLDNMGRSVSLSNDGNVVAVSAPRSDFDSTENSGLVQVYAYSSAENMMTKLGEEIRGIQRNSFFGHSISLSSAGDVIAVGSFGSDSPGLTDNGRVDIFRLVGKRWINVGQAIEGTRNGDQSGVSVSLSDDGRTLAIGTPYHDVNSDLDTGLVRVYLLSNNDSWVQMGKDILGVSDGALYGWSTSISADGRAIAIGSLANNGSNDNGKIGHVQILKFIENEWVQIGQNLNGDGPEDLFGRSVSLSGDGNLVAASGSNAGGSGVVKLFKLSEVEFPSSAPSTEPPTLSFRPTQYRSPSVSPSKSTMPSNEPSHVPSKDIITVPSQRPSERPSERPVMLPTRQPKPPTSDPIWRQVGLLIGEASGDYFGWSVAVSDNARTIAVGAVFDDNVNGKNAGSVKIFRFLNGRYQQLGSTIIFETGAAFDQAGSSVALASNGNTCVIGAQNFSGSNGPRSGAAKVVMLSSNNEWVMKGNLIEGFSVGDKAGSVDISDDGEVIAVGAHLNDNENGDSAGHVRIFTYNQVDNRWYQVGNSLNGESIGDGFGTAVSLSGDGRIIAIGGPNNGYYSGHARVYQLSNNNQWRQLGEDIDGDVRNGSFGGKLSLNSSGNIIAIGMSTGATNVVKVFRFLNNGWAMLGNPISGYDVSLSKDGLTAVVGNSIIGGSGETRVWTFTGGQWIQSGGTLNGNVDGSGFGHSVAMSGDGHIVVVGSPRQSNGDVKVYFDGIGGSQAWLRSGSQSEYPSFPSNPTSSSARSSYRALKAVASIGALILCFQI